VTTALVIAAALALLLVFAFARRALKTHAAPTDAAPDPPPTGSGREERRFGRRRTGPVPEPRKTTNSYAIINQKGGVGKTTVCLALAAAAARRGHTVLLVDLDPRASATRVLGEDDDDRLTVADVMLDPSAHSLADTVVQTDWGLRLSPAEHALRVADCGPATPDASVLPWQLETVCAYDLVLLDCPPNLGPLTLDALTAAARALIVTEPTYLATQAIAELLDAVWFVTDEYNPTLELAGVVVNRVEPTREHDYGLAELHESFGSGIWEPHVPKRVAFQTAMRQGMPPQDIDSPHGAEIAELFDLLAQRLEPARTTLLPARTDRD
jgi:chromosome partitioning protein